MARSLNKAILIGNLGADPEVRTTGAGHRVAQLSVATNRSWTGAQGEVQERTEWHRVVVWGKLVDVVEAYLRKGERVYVEGEIQYRTYEDAEGVTRFVTEINARELFMLGGRAAGDDAGVEAGVPERRPEAARGGRERAVAGASAGRGKPPVEEDELPF